MFIIVIIVLLFFLIVEWFYTKKKCCLNKCIKYNSIEGIKEKPKCSLVKAVYHNLVSGLGKLDTKTFGINNNYKSLNTMCNTGNEVLGRCNQYNWITNPMKNKDFIRLCCNGENDESKCTLGADCIHKKGKLSYKSYGYNDFNDKSADIPSNAEELREYCRLGKDIIDSKCSVDELHPQNDPIFKKYCCNNSNDMSICGPEMVDKCVINNAKFMNQSSTFTNWTDTTPNNDYNAQTLREFCKVGIDTMNCNSNQMKDPYFKKYCCNNSSDSSQCDVYNVDACIVNKAKFLEADKTISSLNPDTIIYNTNIIDNYCNLANILTTKGCSGINTTNYKNYQLYCS